MASDPNSNFVMVRVDDKFVPVKEDSHIACRAHAVPLQCRELIHTRHAVTPALLK